MTDEPWKTLSSDIVYENPWYKVRRDKVIRPDGKPGEYNLVVTTGAAFVVAVNDKQEVLLETIFRYNSKSWSIEPPAGGLDGEEPLTAAKRELKEETGVTAGTWEKLGQFYALNGMCTEEEHFYLATDLDISQLKAQSEEAIGKLEFVPFKKVLEMIKTGKLTDGQGALALLLAAQKLNITA